MRSRSLTNFENILLGMICAEPSSGYDLKQAFASSPLGIYQPSSGSLYPALRRLEQAGLVWTGPPERPSPVGGRTRHVYRATGEGREVHLSWLRFSVVPSTVAADLGMHLVRFVMMEGVVPRDEVISFLEELAEALGAFVADLERYVTPAKSTRPHPSLAVHHGIAVHRASLAWVERTITELS